MAKSMEEKSWIKKLFESRAFRWSVGIPAVLALVLYTASFFLDEPMRSIMEKKLNDDLKGYSVQLPKLHVQLIGLSLTLKGLTVLQQPIRISCRLFPVLKASIHWREILSGRLVADSGWTSRKSTSTCSSCAARRPARSRSRSADGSRRWRHLPLKINSVKINDASITYIDQDPKRPLVLSHLNLQATNIRNVHLRDRVYPSSFHLDTAIFGTGHGSIDGDANFLAEPLSGIKGRLKLEKVPIDYFNTVVAARTSPSRAVCSGPPATPSMRQT